MGSSTVTKLNLALAGITKLGFDTINATNFRTLPIDVTTATSAADLRARYNLRTPDALQIATAITAGCNAFLTNDAALQRVSELRVLVLDQLEL
jgi:predicted nucleic acid-binding protein